MLEKDKQTRREALGKGLDSLLGATASLRPQSPEKFTAEIETALVDTNPYQPRKEFDEVELAHMVESIRQNGILQPVLVRPSDTQGRYILIAGERRLRSAKILGLNRIPAFIQEASQSDEDLLRLALIENIQRSDLTVIEEAKAYEQLINRYNFTQEQCAQSVGKDRSSLANILRLLTLPSEVQDDLARGEISLGHGKALLSLQDPATILTARDMIVKKSLSVRQTETLCRSFRNGKAMKTSQHSQSPDLDYLAETLRSQLRTKVKLSGNANRGRIEISFFSPAELERIMLLIGNSA